ncbi:MAG: hypothetical protein M1582_00480 [Actinobacteria bacterium]|nr:hypothetical protein [Actinomycetota bacterium]
MKSHITDRFRRAFKNLPREVQDQARRAYTLFDRDPYHPSLRFKQVHSTRPIYSVRINVDYRALGVREGDAILWFWIGSHADYDHIVSGS